MLSHLTRGPVGSSRGAVCGHRSGRALPVCASLAASIALVGCSGSSGGDAGFDSGALAVGANAPVVAVLDTIAGKESPFILKGTIPVPPKTFTSKSHVPFTVLDYDGTGAPTQVEPVTFYPKSIDGADVVEILAKVHLAPHVAPGTKVSYEVVLNPHKNQTFRLENEVQKVMNAPDSVVLVAHDVFGHEYRLDLLKGTKKAFNAKSDEVLRHGNVAATIRTHGVLKPTKPNLVSQANGPLHHLFGAHAYTTVMRETNVMSLDLRIHNGLSGLDKGNPDDDPNADLYFADLELWIPTGWRMFQQNPDPGLGQPYQKEDYTVFPIVKPLASGKMHFMPQQGQFHRRLALAAPGEESLALELVDELGRAFCKSGNSPTGGKLWSWWNTQTGRYFPQSFVLPDLGYLDPVAMETDFTNKLNKVRDLIAQGVGGNFPNANPQLGWSQPWGVAYGGMTGGDEIQQWDGVQVAHLGSVNGYRYAQITHRMYNDRMPDVIFNLDGKPTRFPQWILNGPSGPYVQMAFFQKPLGSSDPFGFKQADKKHVDYVRNNNLQPPYEAQLANFAPIDFQHFVRYTRSAKVLAWLGNDPIAKDDLRMHAELFRLSYHKLPQSASGYVGPGMLNDQQYVKSAPGTGFAFGRGQGWGIDAMNAAYAMADKQWRDEARPWFEEVADLVAEGQSNCNGIIQSIVNSKMLDGKYRTRQAIEQGIVENALRGMVETVFRSVDNGRTAQTEYVLEKSYYAMIGPMAWSPNKGPHSYLAVGPVDAAQGTFCGSVPPDGTQSVDHTQTYSSFAYGYQLTGDQQFLLKAGQIFGAPSPTGLLNAIEAQGKNLLEGRAALIAACQNLAF